MVKTTQNNIVHILCCDFKVNSNAFAEWPGHQPSQFNTTHLRMDERERTEREGVICLSRWDSFVAISRSSHLFLSLSFFQSIFLYFFSFFSSELFKWTVKWNTFFIFCLRLDSLWFPCNSRMWFLAHVSCSDSLWLLARHFSSIRLAQMSDK